MTPDLSHARAKLHRASDHVHDFDRDWVAFLKSDPYRVISNFDAKANQTAFTVGKLPQMPDSFAFIIGDAVHNFRSALDHLAFALFKAANPSKSGSHIYFPIAENENEYKARSPRMTKGMPQPARDRIDTLNPYGGAQNMLWPLHYLDIMDKHRLLVPVTVVSAGVMVAKAGEFVPNIKTFPSMRILGEGDVLLEASGDYENDKDMQFTFGVAFAEPEMLQGFSVMVALHLIAGQVGAIIDSF